MENKKVLIVDDDAHISELLSSAFRSAGALVFQASSYTSGLEALKKEQYDLGVVDVMMPDGSGIDLIKVVHTLPGTHPFFMVLTNSMDAVHVADAMDANVTIFLQKADHDPADIVQMAAKHFADEVK